MNRVGYRVFGALVGMVVAYLSISFTVLGFSWVINGSFTEGVPVWWLGRLVILICGFMGFTCWEQNRFRT